MIEGSYTLRELLNRFPRIIDEAEEFRRIIAQFKPFENKYKYLLCVAASEGILDTIKECKTLKCCEFMKCVNALCEASGAQERFAVYIIKLVCDELKVNYENPYDIKIEDLKLTHRVKRNLIKMGICIVGDFGEFPVEGLNRISELSFRTKAMILYELYSIGVNLKGAEVLKESIDILDVSDNAKNKLKHEGIDVIGDLLTSKVYQIDILYLLELRRKLRLGKFPPILSYSFDERVDYYKAELEKKGKQIFKQNEFQRHYELAEIYYRKRKYWEVKLFVECLRNLFLEYSTNERLTEERDAIELLELYRIECDWVISSIASICERLSFALDKLQTLFNEDSGDDFNVIDSIAELAIRIIRLYKEAENLNIRVEHTRVSDEFEYLYVKMCNITKNVLAVFNSLNSKIEVAHEQFEMINNGMLNEEELSIDLFIELQSTCDV